MPVPGVSRLSAFLPPVYVPLTEVVEKDEGYDAFINLGVIKVSIDYSIPIERCLSGYSSFPKSILTLDCPVGVGIVEREFHVISTAKRVTGEAIRQYMGYRGIKPPDLRETLIFGLENCLPDMGQVVVSLHSMELGKSQVCLALKSSRRGLICALHECCKVPIHPGSYKILAIDGTE